MALIEEAGGSRMTVLRRRVCTVYARGSSHGGSPLAGLAHRRSRDAVHSSAGTWLASAATVIALWLGHESAETTDMYLHADLSMKERALSRTAPTGTRQTRYQPGDRLLEFLDSL